MTDQKLNDCGCCEGVTLLTPLPLANPPGLSALVYRAGEHASFKATMLAGISGKSALAGLKTRNDDDPAIGFLDAWAAALDVLTFYQERIANEGYLRTATERRSALELARAIGYELGPGVAASTHLAFTLEEAPGSPQSIAVPVGVKAQSIPGQDELPQTFETVEEIEAHPAWNALRPRLSAPQVLGFGTTEVYLQGIATNLKPGDGLLFIGAERLSDPASERWDFRRVKTVETDPKADRTRVTWDEGLGSVSPYVPPAKNPAIFALRQRAALFGHNAPAWRALPLSLRVGDIDPKFQLTKAVSAASQPVLQTQAVLGGNLVSAGQNLVLAQATASFFLKGAYADLESAWVEAPFAKGTTLIHLDTVYSQIVPGSWAVLVSPDYAECYQVTAAAEESIAQFNISGKTTRLTISGENIELFSRRSTTVLAQSEELAPAEAPILEAVSGESVLLDRLVDGLQPGRWLMVSGRPVGEEQPVSEVARLEKTSVEGGLTRLHFSHKLRRSYRRDSVTINANVARATHGETKQEVLGSGDAGQVWQQFTLKQSPLTHVSAPTANGAASTLEVRVGGVRWHEVANLYGIGANERVYTVRRDDAGKSLLRFGDGASGARLPSGVENVAARYRVGIGRPGMVKAGQIGLLMTRPLGLKEVVNPEAPTGAEDPETLERARSNAPLTVLTLDRIVSLQDFEDFARAFAGIGKAQATWLWDGEKRLVHLTVAADEGGALEPGSDLDRHLRAAIDGARDSHQPVRVDTYTPLAFRLTARVKVDPDHLVDTVLDEVKSALEDAFSFERRGFGQAVTASEVLKAIQAVWGVVAADLDALDFVPGKGLKPRLPARAAYWSGGQVKPAELITVAPDGIELARMP